MNPDTSKKDALLMQLSSQQTMISEYEHNISACKKGFIIFIVFWLLALLAFAVVSLIWSFWIACSVLGLLVLATWAVHGALILHHEVWNTQRSVAYYKDRLKYHREEEVRIQSELYQLTVCK